MYLHHTESNKRQCPVLLSNVDNVQCTPECQDAAGLSPPSTSPLTLHSATQLQPPEPSWAKQTEGEVLGSALMGSSHWVCSELFPAPLFKSSCQPCLNRPWAHTFGILVMPPTRMTSPMSLLLTSASCMAFWQGATVLLIRSATMPSNCARLSFMFKCFGPEASMVR